MGASTFKGLFGGKEMRLLMVGLDGAGKTTILYRINFGKIVRATVMGCKVETVKYKRTTITGLSIGGNHEPSSLLRRYFPNVQGLIFVVDSNDIERITEAKEALDRILQEHELRDVTLLVYLNKQDQPNAMDIEDVMDKLELRSLHPRNWYMQICYAIGGHGLYEGMEWLTGQLKKEGN